MKIRLQIEIKHKEKIVEIFKWLTKKLNYLQFQRNNNM